MRLALESLEERVTPCDNTSLVPGSIALNFFGNAQSPQFTLPVTVNDTDHGGVATSGTVTINLVSGNTTITLGSATVGSNGEADVDVNLGALPANLQVGNYTLEENFQGNSSYYSCSGNATLTVSSLTTTVVPVSVTFNYSNTGTVTQTGSQVIPIGADADNFAVLYEGEGGHTLHVSNVVINGNVGVGGTGCVNIDGHADINGNLDFAGDADGKFDNADDQGDDDNSDKDHGNGNGSDKDNGSDKKDNDNECGPTAINANDAAVTAALNAVNALSASLAGTGTSIQINGTQTINESDGQLVTLNGVSYRVFNVTSCHLDDNDVLTIKGDGSGIPVVFDFDGKDDVNLGGNVVLKNGLTPDQVMWNVTGSGGHVHLHGSDDHHPDLAFQGIIVAPHDTIDLDNANLIGRVIGGDDTDMQIVGNTTINAPTPVTTVTTTTSGSFTISVDVASPDDTVSGGTVTFDIVAGNQTIQLGTATVGPNGVATLTVTNPSTLQELASLLPGSYQLDLTYSGSTPFSGSSSTTTVTITPEQTTVVVPPVNVTVNQTTNINITVNVNSPNGPVGSGTVTLDLVNGNQTIPLGTATVGPNGTVTLNIPSSVLSSLPPGQYQLVVNFNAAPGTPNGNTTTTAPFTLLPETQPSATTGTGGPTSFGPGTGPATPSAPPLNPLVAAIELALDAAMLGNMTNPGSVGELEMFAQTFLGHSIPTAIPQLLSDIQSLLPQTGPFFGPALQFAGYLDIDLPIENPM